jgi:hypothetical protein
MKTIENARRAVMIAAVLACVVATSPGVAVGSAAAPVAPAHMCPPAC